MNLDSMRSKVKEKEGTILHFKVNGSRNQIEEFNGEIIELYPSIFLVRLEGEENKIKSFSYSDLITESVEIISWRVCCQVPINFLQLQKR